MKDSSYVNGLALLLFLGLSSCSNEPAPPDVSDIDVKLTLLRFDEALPALDTTEMVTSVRQLDRRFGSFTEVFFRELVPVRRGDFSPAEQQRVLRAYLDYPLTHLVDSTVQDKFSAGAQVQDLLEGFTQALRYYRYYLPEAPLPDTLVTYVSHFELAAFLYGEGQLAAGLDFFLGPDFEYQLVDPQEPIFSAYLSQAYTPDHFSGKLLRVLLDDRYPAPRSGRLIDYLIHEGKKLYLLEKLLPDSDEATVYEVTQSEMQWLRDNETQIYAHLQQQDDLYATDVNKINKYTRPAPYSPGMPPESPGGAVNFVGRQVVASYMRVNPEVTIPQLMEISDGQEILRGARYKPR